MKKMKTLGMTLLMALSLSACAGATKDETPQAENQKTVNIASLNGIREKIEIEVPYDPERIAILDMASLDIIDKLGLGDRVVGSAKTSLEYLQSYANNDKIEKLGTIKEADLEAVMKADPDIIFIGGRLSKSYDQLTEIAPVVYLATDAEKGLVKSVEDNALTIAKIFGKEDQVASKMADFGKRIDALKKNSEGQTAVLGLTTSGSFNVLGNDGRLAMIATDIGFENIGIGIAASKKDEKEKKDKEASTAAHGNETSFELILGLNPDYIFVMDRDAAIQTEGAKAAKEIIENELIKKTEAYTQGNIVYLSHPAVWYTAEGGITALDIMLQDLEEGLAK